MKTRRGGKVKDWASDITMRLLKDLAFDDDAWEIVFDWVKENVKLGESYPAVLRKAKQWALADKIRDELGNLGVTVEDTAQGSTWRMC